MFERSEVAIIVPAYNEAETITRVVDAILNYGVVIVIDDCSSDATGSLAQAAGAVVIRHHHNQGYDGALNSGFMEAGRRGCSYALTFDADGQHDDALIRLFVSNLKQGYDMVAGVRPGYARFSERLFAFYTKKRFDLHDPLCGMKGYRMALYHEQGWFDSYKSIGTELMFYAIAKDKSLLQIEIPISLREGRSRFGQKWKANYRILRAMILSVTRSL